MKGNKSGRAESGIRVFSPPKKKTKAGRAAGIILTVLSVAVFWLGLWFLLALKINSELLLPSPVTVFRRLFELSGTSELWRSAGSTILRILAGYAAGIMAGTLLAALSAWSKHMAALLAPPGRIIKATPVASFIILALVWIPANNIPSFIVFLLVTPIVWDALKTALISTDPDLLEMARVYRFGRLKTVLNVYIPSSVSAYLSSVLTALGLAWKAGIAAEVLCLPKLSIGRRLYESKIYLEMPDLFAWTTLVVILSVVMEALIRLAVRKVTVSGKNKAAVNAEADGEAAAVTERAAAGYEAQTAAAVTGSAADGNEVQKEAAMVSGPAAGEVADDAADDASDDIVVSGIVSARPIEICDLYKSYGSNIIFSGLSASIPDGITCLTGPSGSGKTTLGRILAGLEGAEGGCIRASGGEPVFLFQDPRLL
ncbi:MAG: hypothetical protein J5950_05940, partial [Clostridia bacterium]|nr:hypothetical protein [Clostridia bacterium]